MIWVATDLPAIPTGYLMLVGVWSTEHIRTIARQNPGRANIKGVIVHYCRRNDVNNTIKRLVLRWTQGVR